MVLAGFRFDFIMASPCVGFGFIMALARVGAVLLHSPLVGGVAIS